MIECEVEAMAEMKKKTHLLSDLPSQWQQCVPRRIGLSAKMPSPCILLLLMHSISLS